MEGTNKALRFKLELTKPRAYLLAVALVFLIPISIPVMGVDWPFLFTVGLVLIAWVSIKWGSIKAVQNKSRWWEMVLGGAVIAIDYAENIYFHSFLGLIDMLAVFVAVTIAFYGVKSMKFFWVPAGYIVILLAGYQIEYYVPSVQGLQVWLANLMASLMQSLGVHATATGDVVILGSSSSQLSLQVDGPCTGIQGVLAFGMLSSMAVLDIKAKWSRILPLFAIGFFGAFLINIARLFGVFLTFEYLGVELGKTMHVYLGYTLFIVWVLVFWMIAFKYLPSAPIGNRMGALPPPKNLSPERRFQE
ncbi:MAG: archaeosortase/exosortase family protein [Nitrososphaerales archaeon]